MSTFAAPSTAITAPGRRLARLRDRVRAWLARGRERSATVALESLDERSLRDIGLARSELGSVRAELEGRVEATRLRVLQDLPRGGAA
ncbi:hypothetical protein [uncultured Piscinibacter sp.]|uniref:hypothetical protein n=1 Tax=uncultured Piscinibacter sp. TaxID=1131835 RepID=UPI002639092A|nr:hypothetical protein [uncultured Piscinibacter sp.]